MHIKNYLLETEKIAKLIDVDQVESMAQGLVALRNRGGRLFMLGVGGSAANCSHAVNDFRKLCGIETYSPADNVSELTARINDDGWENVFADWLRLSRLSEKDAIFVLSVGGGNIEKGVSLNIVRALDLAVESGVTIFGVVGRDGGYAKKVGSNVIVIPTVNADRVTPHAEAFQAVIWHGLVSHPDLQIKPTKW